MESVLRPLFSDASVHVVLLLDHIVSGTSRVNDVCGVSQLLRSVGDGGSRSTLVVDGAHAVGAIPLDFDNQLANAVDFYCSNLHKWCFTPRSCAFLWVSERFRDATRPLLVSHAHNGAYRSRFMVQATRDDSRWAVLPAVEQFVNDKCGGLPRLQAHLHAFAAASANRLAAAWSTKVSKHVVHS